MRSPLPELPDPRVAIDSARAWGQADAVLGALLASGLSPPKALVRWGAGLLRSGRADDAAMAFRVALALAPDDASAWTSVGIALDRTGATDSAVASLERSVALVRRQPDTWLLLGMAREKQGDVAHAEDDYRVALELEPTSAAAWKCLGARLQRKGDAVGAVEALEACLKHGGPDAAVSASLGKLLYEEGRLREAHDAYETAARADPQSDHFWRMERRTRFLRDVVDGASVDDAMASLQGARSAHTPLSDDERSELFEIGSSALVAFGHKDAALRLSRRRVELFPGSAAARYLLSSLMGEATVARSPDDYLVESFDAFAEGFDAQLVGVLGYDVPEKLCRLVKGVADRGRLYDTLDGGCGTGLCGPLIRPLARRLVGVDLSPKMLACSERRGVYDALVREELTTFLKKEANAFDLMLAADVLIYFGDLAPLFDAARGALRPGALLAVSAEFIDTSDYRLGTSGRFAHRPSYVRAVAQPAFEVLETQGTTLRREGRDRVFGHLFVMRRRADSSGTAGASNPS